MQIRPQIAGPKVPTALSGVTTVGIGTSGIVKAAGIGAIAFGVETAGIVGGVCVAKGKISARSVTVAVGLGVLLSAGYGADPKELKHGTATTIQAMAVGAGVRAIMEAKTATAEKITLAAESTAIAAGVATLAAIAEISDANTVMLGLSAIVAIILAGVAVWPTETQTEGSVPLLAEE